MKERKPSLKQTTNKYYLTLKEFQELTSIPLTEDLWSVEYKPGPTSYTSTNTEDYIEITTRVVEE